MKRFVVLCVLLCVFKEAYGFRSFWRGRLDESTLDRSEESLVIDQWFTQTLDHFDTTNTATWQQRFFVNSNFYKTGGPIFLLLSGESGASTRYIQEGAWIQYAKEHGALCIEIEHRFYGKSHPTADLSIENLSYLNAQQALADFAAFIKAQNVAYGLNENQKWVVYGASYGASLAGWLRQKYPHLVHGAVTSSAVVLAKADVPEYHEVVAASLSTHSYECPDSVKTSFTELDNLIKTSEGKRIISEKFHLCDPIENSINEKDITNLFEVLADSIANVVQYNNDNRAGSVVNIDQICDIMVNTTSGATIDRLAAVNSLILNVNDNTCLDYKYDNVIQALKNVNYPASMWRQWTYQTCTEFGFYQTSSHKAAIFGDHFNLDFFVQQCSDIFGPGFNLANLNKGVEHTNNLYGGYNPNSTNVIYVTGSIDPWHPLGLTSSTDPTKPTVFIIGSAHVSDFYEPREQDTPQLKNARVQIRKFLASIL